MPGTTIRFCGALRGASSGWTLAARRLVLPLFTDHEIPYGVGRVQLEPGDLLFIFTDGVAEAVNDKGEEFGEPRIVPGNSFHARGHSCRGSESRYE